MKALLIVIILLNIQVGFAQLISSEKHYKLHSSFKIVEDSIANKINYHNSIIYWTCEGYRVFFLIEENSHWTGYFIKNLIIGELYPPSEEYESIDGNTVKIEPYLTELIVFSADSLVQSLITKHIYEVQQISEEAIQNKFIRKGKKKNEYTMQSLPRASHDCNGTIIIYGNNTISATYRGVLIAEKEMHRIPTLKIFFDTGQILINAMKSYYR